MKNLILLVDQLVWKSELDDRLQESKNNKIVRDADGWMTYHLKLLKKELIAKEELDNAKNKGKS